MSKGVLERMINEQINSCTHTLEFCVEPESENNCDRW